MQMILIPSSFKRPPSHPEASAQVSLQFFDREKRPVKGWLGGKLGAGQDDRQFWEAWVLNLAVSPSTAAQHYQGTPTSGERLCLKWQVVLQAGLPVWLAGDWSAAP